MITPMGGPRWIPRGSPSAPRAPRGPPMVRATTGQNESKRVATDRNRQPSGHNGSQQITVGSRRLSVVTRRLSVSMRFDPFRPVVAPGPHRAPGSIGPPGLPQGPPWAPTGRKWPAFQGGLRSSQKHVHFLTFGAIVDSNMVEKQLRFRGWDISVELRAEILHYRCCHTNLKGPGAHCWHANPAP